MNKKMVLIIVSVIFIIFIVNVILLLNVLFNKKDDNIKLEKNTQNEIKNNIANNVSENKNLTFSEEDNASENSNILTNENIYVNTTIPNENNNLPNNEPYKDLNTEPNETQPNQNNDKTEKEKINATKEYYCVGDAKLDGDKCVTTYTMDAIKQYVCSQGQLSGSKCKITSQKSLPINQYSGSYESCLNRGLSGYNLFSCACSAMGGKTDGYSSGNYSCLKNVTSEVDATLSYSCVDGTTLVGDKCIAIFSINAGYNYSCPSGYSLIGNMCEKQ